jgi:hypothetical protein
MEMEMESLVEQNVEGLTSLHQLLGSLMCEDSTVGYLKINGLLIETRYVIITPSFANYLMKHRNPRNRKINKTRVNLFTNSMLNDKWRFNGDTIRFDYNGDMLDGQHRLLAIINSNKSQVVTLISGLDPSVFDSIDVGGKRSGSDTLSVNNVPSPTLTASVVKFIFAFEHNKYSANRNTVRNLANDEIHQYYTALNDVDASVRFVGKMVKRGQHLLTPSMLGGLHYILAQNDVDNANDFLEKVYLGTNVDEDSYIYSLRNKLVKAKFDKNFKITNKVLIESISYVWKKCKEGKTGKNIKLPNEFEISFE